MCYYLLGLTYVNHNSIMKTISNQWPAQHMHILLFSILVWGGILFPKVYLKIKMTQKTYIFIVKQLKFILKNHYNWHNYSKKAQKLPFCIKFSFVFIAATLRNFKRFFFKHFDFDPSQLIALVSSTCRPCTVK